MLSLALLALLAPSAATAERPTVPVPVIRTPPIVTTKLRPAFTPSFALQRGMVKLTPREAVMKAADAAPGGVIGVFEMRVSRAEQVGPNFFLNSEEDYRDPRNLSVRIEPRALKALQARRGENLRRAFVGETVRVFGKAQRVRIDFVADGRPSGKYYYQTHVAVGDARQIELAGPD